MQSMFGTHSMKQAEEWRSEFRCDVLRTTFRRKGLRCGWKLGGSSQLLWALESFPEDLWSCGALCPAERAVMLAATSRRVRTLMARLHKHVPAAVSVKRSACIDSVVVGLPRLLAWCQVVTMEVERIKMFDAQIGDAGMRSLAGGLGLCSALAKLNLKGNDIGADGARSLAWVLVECSCSLAVLNLEKNGIGHEGVRSLEVVLVQCSSLAELNLADNDIGAEGARILLDAKLPGLRNLYYHSI